MVITAADREAANKALDIAFRGDTSSIDEDMARLFADHKASLIEALRPFVDLRSQSGAWGVISKKLDGLAPMTVTVTKDQMRAAFNALTKASAEHN